MAQRLSQIDPNAEVLFGPDEAGRIDPSLRLLALEVVAGWSLVDHALTSMVCAFVQDEHHIVSDMVAAIENTGARSAAFNAAARRALGEGTDEYAVFDRLMRRLVKKRKSSRNRYAHFLFGHSPSVPNAMLLIDPRGLAAMYGGNRRGGTQLLKFLDRMPEGEVVHVGLHELDMPTFERMPDFSYVYDEARIRLDIATAAKLWKQTMMLQAAVDLQHPMPALLPQLSSELGVEDPDDQVDD